MTDPFQVREDRHPGVGLDAPHQPLAAPRDDHVDMLGIRQHRADGRPVPRRHPLDRIRRQPSGAQAIHQRRMDRAGAVKTLGPTAKDYGISSLQTERTRIRRHIWSTFINHANDP